MYDYTIYLLGGMGDISITKKLVDMHKKTNAKILVICLSKYGKFFRPN